VIFHLYSHFEPEDPELVRRLAFAQETWKAQLWTEIPVKDEELPRLFEQSQRVVPYLRDLFDYACAIAKDENAIIVQTNADILVRSDACLEIAAAMQDTDACYCYRRDFGRLVTPLADKDYARGYAYVGSDLHAFRVRWWRKHRDNYPDMAMFEAYDPVLRHLMDFTNPKGTTRLYDLIAHERHDSAWERPKNRYSWAGQRHNLSLAIAWMKKHGIKPQSHGIPDPLPAK